MKISKKLWIILASSVGGVAVAGTTTVGVVSNLPKNVFAKSIVGVFDDAVEREEIEPIYKMLQKGSLEFSLSEIKEDGENYLEKQSYSGKMYFSEKGFAMQDMHLDMGNFELEGDLYVSEDLAYVEEAHVLNGTYGIEWENLSGDLENSIFAYGSKTDYAMQDKELYEALLQAMDCPVDKMRKDMEKVAKKYAKQIWKIVSRNADFDSETQVERLGGERKSVRVVSMSIDGDDMADILEDVYAFMEKDTSLVKVLKKYQDAFSIYYLEADEKSGEPTNIVEAYEMWLEDVGDNLEDTCEYYEDNFEEITIEVATPKLSSKLLKFTVIEEDKELFSVDFGTKGVKKTDIITFEQYDSVYGDTDKYVYEVRNSDKREYKSTLKVNGEKLLTVNIDRVKDKYEVKTGELTFEGEISTKGQITTLTLDKIVREDSHTTSYSESYTMTTDLKVVIDAKDKMPSAPKRFATIADITEEDIDKWSEKFGELGETEPYYDGHCDICDAYGVDYYEDNYEYCFDCYMRMKDYDGYCDECGKQNVFTTVEGVELCYSCWAFGDAVAPDIFE